MRLNGWTPKPPTPAPGVNVDTFLATPDMSKHLTFHYCYAKTLYLVTPGNTWSQHGNIWSHLAKEICHSPYTKTLYLVKPGNTWSHLATHSCVEGVLWGRTWSCRSWLPPLPKPSYISLDTMIFPTGPSFMVQSDFTWDGGKKCSESRAIGKIDHLHFWVHNSAG